MPKALAAMLFGTAYLAAIIGFSGVIYLRGLALVYADIIQYPILLGAMAGLGCLLVPLSRTVFRRLRVYSRSAIPADDLSEQWLSCCSTQQLHFSGP